MRRNCCGNRVNKRFLEFYVDMKNKSCYNYYTIKNQKKTMEVDQMTLLKIICGAAIGVILMFAGKASLDDNDGKISFFTSVVMIVLGIAFEIAAISLFF